MRAKHLFSAAIASLVLTAIAFPLDLRDDEVVLRFQNAPMGTRVILEFTARPGYEVRKEADRVVVSLHGSFHSIPYKSKNFSEPVLTRYKLDRSSRQTDLLFYTGPEFSVVSSFEMTAPFRLVLEFKRRASPAPAPLGAGTQVGESEPPSHQPPTSPAPSVPEEGRVPITTKQPGIQVIVVDPGHGGVEMGAKGPSGLLEKEVTLDMAKRLQAGLTRRLGTRVILTRETDKQVALDDRTALANHERADLFISIHVNASRADRARGAETYFLSYQATDDEARAAAALENNTIGVENPSGNTALGMVLWDLAQSQYLSESSKLAETIQENLNQLLRIESRGVKQAPFKVLMGATMPAVLVEIGFITNPEEESHLKDGAYRERIAQAIIDSVAAFKDRVEKQLGLR
ncbi:MAG TPA: N-acetylmuramoyl-L-alanine amidase [Candidatus Polarisedimenticolia bacterium]|nr:N-acetylmuramoyl-L-alanine amidase [Candidatus Polarisedimenticolia bacterium]